MEKSVSHPISTLDQYRLDMGCDESDFAIYYSLFIISSVTKSKIK